MADLDRHYRRWLLQRLAALLPAVVGAASVAVRQAIILDLDSSALWIHLACLGAAVVLGGFCSFLAIQCLLCRRHLRTRDYRSARELRRDLDLAGPAGIVCLSLVVLIAVLPACFPPLDPLPTLPLRRMALPIPPVPALNPPFAPTENNSAASDVSAKKEESRTPSDTLRAVRPSDARFYDLEQEDSPYEWLAERPPHLGRLGVPDRDKPFDWMRPGLHVELALFDPAGTLSREDGAALDFDHDLDMRAAGVRLWYDLPTTRSGSLRFQYQLIGMTAGEALEDAADPSRSSLLVWQRLGWAYLWQLAGYTSDAEFDLSIFAGVMGDHLLASAYGGAASELLRLSPYVGGEFGFWQGGPAGLSFRFGQTIPVNLTGADARVTEVTVLLRLDVSDRMSLAVGYAAYWAKFASYPEQFSTENKREDLSLRLHGPTLALDVRF